MDRIQTDTHLNTSIYGAYLCDARLSHTAIANAKPRQRRPQRAVFPYSFFLSVIGQLSCWALWNAPITENAAAGPHAIPRKGIARMAAIIQVPMSCAWDVQAMTRAWLTWSACWHGKLQEILSKRKPRVMDRLAPAIREVSI